MCLFSPERMPTQSTRTATCEPGSYGKGGPRRDPTWGFKTSKTNSPVHGLDFKSALGSLPELYG